MCGVVYGTYLAKGFVDMTGVDIDLLLELEEEKDQVTIRMM